MKVLELKKVWLKSEWISFLSVAGLCCCVWFPTQYRLFCVGPGSQSAVHCHWSRWSRAGGSPGHVCHFLSHVSHVSYYFRSVDWETCWRSPETCWQCWWWLMWHIHWTGSDWLVQQTVQCPPLAPILDSGTGPPPAPAADIIYTLVILVHTPNIVSNIHFLVLKINNMFDTILADNGQLCYIIWTSLT